MNNYKVILFGKQIYQEIELYGKNEKGVYAGTTKKCSYRFNREMFFDDFEISILPQDGKWKISCGESIYFLTDGLMKQYAMTLQHGDEVMVKYQNSNADLMKISFLIDFDNLLNNYDRVISLSGKDVLTVGGKAQSNICIKDELVGEDSFRMEHTAQGYKVIDAGTKYGVYINGFKMFEKEQLLEDTDFIMLDGYSFYLKDAKLYTSVDEHMTFQDVSVQDYVRDGNQMEYPKFQRNTRIHAVLPDEKIEVLPPKTKKDKPKRNLLMSLIPALASMVLMVALRGVMGGGGMFVLYSAAMMGMGIVTSVITYINDGKEYREDTKQRRKQYLEYAAEKEDDIKELRDKELQILNKKYITLEEDVNEVTNFDSHLFEKGKEDDDYLTVRIGTGDVKANCEIEYRKQEFKDTEDDLMDYPEKLADAYEYIKDAPVCVDLKEINCLGVVGKTDALYEMLKNLTIDVSVRHYYQDVKFFYLFDEKDYSNFVWLRWLRNVKNDRNSTRNFMYDDESGKLVLEELYSELSSREGLKEDQIKQLTHYIVFAYSRKAMEKHPVSKYISECKKYGFSFVFFEEYEELLPTGCDRIVRLHEDGVTGTLVNAEDSEDTNDFHYTTIPNRVAEGVALKLGCVYVEEVSLESSLTKNISLYELLNIQSVDDLDIQSRWANSKVYESMAAPLGVKSGDEVVCLDLHEKYHGPHGLVAGTTGSGKSEILQSYILSMATLFHPYEVGFVIIDFKGGGMVNQFKNLPHLVGSITNIDEGEIDRSLSSIQAELKKRQRLFAQYEVNHIDAYIKKYKAGVAKIALPHLILIVDEFAELKSDQPEFMKELISAARIGRSLGVHLILATQKPSGVVDEQIWSNSKFKLCLKVQNKNDSNEVLKSPLAAEIKEPGRAYLQVGNNEIFELFQSAYSGAGADNSQIGKKKEFTIYDVNLLGKRSVVFQQKNQKVEKTITQLDAIVDYVDEYCKEQGIEKLPGICLPSLEEVIPYTFAAPCFEIPTDVGTVLGVYDAPQEQKQDITFINFTQENTFILGSSQYGKTNLIQTMIKGLAMNYSPEEVNIYILDFASMILKMFEPLAHVGGVITSSEDEKLKNFFKMMTEELVKRKEILSKLGFSSYSTYKDAGYKDLPQIVIFIDNLTALKELYLQDNDDLLHICREGISVGMCVVAANAQTAGMGYKYLANFAKRIALYCNDSSEYSSLFEHCKKKIRAVPGRGIVDLNKELYEFQTYLAFDGEKEVERMEEVRAFIEEINGRFQNVHAKQIPEIPKVLDRAYIKERFYDIQTKKYQIMAGLDYATVSPVFLNMAALGVMGITGPEKSGKGNFVRHMVYDLERHRSTEPAQVYVIDDITKKYEDLQQSAIIEKYTVDVNAITEILEEFAEKLQKRYDDMVSGNDAAFKEAPLLLLLIQNQDVANLIQSDKKNLENYKNITTRFKNMKVAMVFTNIANAAVSFSAPEPLKNLKDNKNWMIFDDVANIKVADIPMKTAKEMKKKIETGDGFYLKDNEVMKLKTVLDKREV